MKLTKIQYKKLEKLMTIARKPAKVSNYKFMCAMFYIIENVCKWGILLKKSGKWHTVYMKFNRWSKNGTISKAIAFFLLNLIFSSTEKTKITS